MRHRRTSRANTVKAYSELEPPIWQPGAEPGIDAAAENAHPRLEAMRERCDIAILDFSHDTMSHFQADNDTLHSALVEPRTDGTACRWISVNGLSWDVIKLLGNHYGLHRLAIEDLINTRSRTKVDWYSDHAFAILTLQKLVRVHNHGNNEQCNCSQPGYSSSSDSDDLETEKKQKSRPTKSWWTSMLHSGKTITDLLPSYEESDPVVKKTHFVTAHSSTSADSPVQPIRTLHRYEGEQNPEHTAFMEKHSALAQEDLVVSVEQVAIFLMADNTVISFFEHSADDIEYPIIERLASKETMLRRSGDASLLVEAIIDAIVDLAMPVKDAYNKARKDLQIDVLTNPDIGTAKSLHIFNEEIDMLQNLFKPIVHLVNALRDHVTDPLSVPPPAKTEHTQQRTAEYALAGNDGKPIKRAVTASTQAPAVAASSVVITPLAHTYLGDVLDHCITIIQSLEQMDASANNLSSLIFNTVGANTNNFMMILALVTVFFSPLTFLAGYFGMNFHRFDALDYSDAFFWATGIPVTFVFMMFVSGGIMWRGLRNRVAKLHIRRSRKERKKTRDATR